MWHHHGSDTPTFLRAILHLTDPNAPNISGGECTTVVANARVADTIGFLKYYPKLQMMYMSNAEIVYYL